MAHAAAPAATTRPAIMGRARHAIRSALGQPDCEFTGIAGEADEAKGVRALDLDGDADAFDDLWQVTLGGVWPLEPGRLASVATGGLVIDGDNALDAAAVVNGSALVALLVVPHRQRRGLGTALLGSTGPASIGAGGDKYLWPGVPRNLPGALQFFHRASRGVRVGDDVQGRPVEG